MTINPFVEKKIKDFIQDYLNSNKTCTVGELLENYDGEISLFESEIRSTINNSIKEGYLKIIKKSSSLDESTIVLVKAFLQPKQRGVTKIVISKPKLSELGFENVRFRNDQIETKDCFKEIINSSRNFLWICSPFLEKNVLVQQAFPELEQLLSDALERGVRIVVLSREIFKRRSDEVRWIYSLAEDLDRTDQVKIFDYHHDIDKKVFSSTHAKLIISDGKRAYIGSAELRKNSLITNFEVGCYIEGPQVLGLCEAFDLMISKARQWK